MERLNTAWNAWKSLPKSRQEDSSQLIRPEGIPFMAKERNNGFSETPKGDNDDLISKGCDSPNYNEVSDEKQEIDDAYVLVFDDEVYTNTNVLRDCC